jgi:lysophospholipase L1-like esterase
VIVVEGSLNERVSNPQALASAADATLAHLKAAAGRTTHILVLGASATPYTPAATIDWINAAIAAAASHNGLQFVDPAAEHWLDPQNPDLWADPDHPNDLGYQVMADHLEPLLRALVGG